MIQHENSTINVFLAAAPPTRASFGLPLWLVDQAAGNTLGGSLTAIYGSATEVRDAESAGELATTTADDLVVAFSQEVPIEKIKVGKVDTAGGQTYGQALDAVAGAVTDASQDFYAVAADTRSATELISIGASVAAMPRIAVLQTSDGDAITAGVPAALAGLVTNGARVALLYHPDNGAPAALSWACARLIFNPDQKSSPWAGPVLGIGSSGIATLAERDAASANHINLGIPFSSASYVVSPGVLLDGRPIYERITADWLKARLTEDLALLKLDAMRRGDKIEVSEVGQLAVRGVIRARLDQGVAAGHFPDGQVLVEPQQITDADRQARILRFRTRSQIAADADRFDLNVYLERDPVVEG